MARGVPIYLEMLRYQSGICRPLKQRENVRRVLENLLEVKCLVDYLQLSLRFDE
jgi:hypothetical protein